MKFQTDLDHEESQREGRQVVGILNGGAVERKVGVKTNPLPFSYWAAISGLWVESLTDPGDMKKSINVLIPLQFSCKAKPVQADVQHPWLSEPDYFT